MFPSTCRRQPHRGRRAGPARLRPYSDLDLVLLHNGTAGIDRIAAALWYPIWDARLGLDHSVRTLPEALSVAPRRRQGLARPAGRPAHRRRRRAVRRADRRHLGPVAAHRRTPAAAAQGAHHSRWATHGELAFLLEGDLKEAAGGLRDLTILRGIGRAGVADTMRPAVRAANLRLLDTRDALHLAVGRRVDRLVAQERAAVAELLEVDDGDALLRRVAGDAADHRARPGRRLARRRPAAQRPPPGRPGRAAARRPVARDVVEQDGELVLGPTAIGPVPDPSLSLRVAAAAADRAAAHRPRHLRVARRVLPAAADPWPPAARRRAGLRCSAPARACCPPGRPATGTA
jgi:[protein-PII] uridylyltransferase